MYPRYTDRACYTDRHHASLYFRIAGQTGSGIHATQTGHATLYPCYTNRHHASLYCCRFVRQTGNCIHATLTVITPASIAGLSDRQGIVSMLHRQGMLHCIHATLTVITPASIAGLPDRQGMVSMLHRRAREEKVHVRKAALQALHKFILFEAPAIKKEVPMYSWDLFWSFYLSLVTLRL